MEKLILLLCTLIFTSLLGCSDDKQKPEEKIIGQWMQIGIGFGGEIIIHSEPSEEDYTAFLPNGKIRNYSSSNEYTEKYTYRIDDNFLYWNLISDEEATGGHWKYKYEFFDDMMKIEVVEGLVNNWDTFIYKKKK